MKFNSTISFLSGIFVSILSLHAQTSIPGGNVSGTWTLSGSPYIVTGNITVPNDSTLTIQPGVTVDFQYPSLWSMKVLGRLIAVGTGADSIRFTSTSPSPIWGGIRFENTTNNNDTSRISYCLIERGFYAFPVLNGT